MSKKPSRKTIITKLDSIFSQYIRLRYSKNEIATCVTCGKQDHWKKMQNGHFVSRKHYATRWDEDNCQVQCSGCNVFRYGEQYLFSKYLGADLSEELLMKSRKIQKFSDSELLDMIELYNEKVNNLLI
jgi:5-methylcytosine-specific restriction endonuclease McrA